MIAENAETILQALVVAAVLASGLRRGWQRIARAAAARGARRAIPRRESSAGPHRAPSLCASNAG